MLKQPKPGVRTRKNLLLTAMAPVGTTLYIYGGGWNREDTGASPETRTLGVSPYWKEFFDSQDANYRYRDDSDPLHSYYPYDGLNRYSHLGLDCSGYIGWILYNVLQYESGKPGYVVEASKGAKMFAQGFGLGTWSHHMDISKCRPGDLISMKGHIWMYIGRCEDGSIVIVHSSVIKSRTGEEGGGVQLGVLNPETRKGYKEKDKVFTENREIEENVSYLENQKTEENCQAYRLVESFYKKHFPEWYKRYPVTVKPWEEYMNETERPKETGMFLWKNDILKDPDGIALMSVEELLLSVEKSFVR